MSFSVENINSTIGNATQSLESAVAKHNATMDPNNAKDMLQAQTLMMKYTNALGLQSTMLKTLSDALKGVVQKIG